MERAEIFVIVRGFYFEQPQEYCEAFSYDLKATANDTGKPVFGPYGKGKTEEEAQDALYHIIKHNVPEVTFVRADGTRRSYPEILQTQQTLKPALEAGVFESLVEEIHPAAAAGNDKRVVAIISRIVREGSSPQMWKAMGVLQTTARFAFYRDMVAK